MSMFGGLFRDARYTLRGWRRAPGFTFAAAFTVALGVGATTAIFSVANCVLLQTPHGVRDPGGLAGVQPIDSTTGEPDRRSKGLGLRIALGADAMAVRRAVLRDGLRLTGIGLGVGCALAFAAGSFLPSMLYGLSPADPLTYAGIVAALLGVSLVAGYVPARRATRVDSMRVLRSE